MVTNNTVKQLHHQLTEQKANYHFDDDYFYFALVNKIGRTD